jgi:hypothetical protein
MLVSGLLGERHPSEPAFGWYLPGSQGVHVPLPSLEVPGWQALHVADGVKP